MRYLIYPLFLKGKSGWKFLEVLDTGEGDVGWWTHR